MTRWNGGVIGVANNPTSTSAKGIWSLSEATKAIKAGLWPSTAIPIDYLVVAGGGGGGGGLSGVYNAGTGGGGGFLTSTEILNPGTTYTVTVGGGGSGGNAAAGGTGSNSSLSGTGLTTVLSYGGGG